MLNSKLISIAIGSVVLLAVAYIGWNEMRKMKKRMSEMEKSVSRIKHNNNVIINKNLTLQKQKETQFDNLNVDQIEELINRYESKISELSSTEEEDDNDNQREHFEGNLNDEENEQIQYQKHLLMQQQMIEQQMMEQQMMEQQMMEQQTKDFDASNNQLLDNCEESLQEESKEDDEDEQHDEEENTADDDDNDDNDDNNDNDDEEDDDEDEEVDDETSEETEEEMTNSKEEIQELIKNFYYKKTNSELKEMLKVYNKPTKGNKINLVDRVLEIEEYNNINLINKSN